MEKIKKFLLALTLTTFPITNSSSLSFENEIKMNQDEVNIVNEAKIKTNVNYFNNIKMEFSFNFVNKNQIEVKIFLINHGEKVELDNIELDMRFDENIFKITNKKSDVFKTKLVKLENRHNAEIKLKEIRFLMKKSKKLEINSNSTKEIIKLTLDIKNKFNRSESNIDLLLKSNDCLIQNFSQKIKVPQNVPIIEKISILELDTDLNFNKDTEVDE